MEPLISLLYPVIGENKQSGAWTLETIDIHFYISITIFPLLGHSLDISFSIIPIFYELSMNHIYELMTIPSMIIFSVSNSIP